MKRSSNLLKVSSIRIEVRWSGSPDHGLCTIVCGQQIKLHFEDFHTSTYRRARLVRVAGWDSAYSHTSWFHQEPHDGHAHAHPQVFSKCFENYKQENPGLIVDLTHIIQVKSDERLGRFVLIFFKKQNMEWLASSTDLSCRHQDSTFLKHTFFSALDHTKPTRWYSVILILILMCLKLRIPILSVLRKILKEK